MNPLFALDSIFFSHPKNEQPLLDGVSLTLGKNERIGILGANGSGKSTLLHLGAGLVKPDTGRVLYGGKECRTERDFAAARKSLGYLLQQAGDQLFCSTVLEDVAFGPYNLGHSAAESEQKARAALADLRLSHVADQNGQRLSGGEQKLAALATVLAMDVKMLFLDEPTNDLDEQARELLLEVLARCNLPGLFVSHDLPFLRATCTRFCLLRNGRLETAPPDILQST